jgi:energy-coupling factor transporter ATP-binding protein EcfA2
MEGFFEPLLEEERLCYNKLPDMVPLITFESVSYQYQTADGLTIPSIQNLSLTIGEGEFVAVIGANGSGKSTFARLINGLLVSNDGVVRVAGCDTRDPRSRARIRSLVGMCSSFPKTRSCQPQ